LSLKKEKESKRGKEMGGGKYHRNLGERMKGALLKEEKNTKTRNNPEKGYGG